MTAQEKSKLFKTYNHARRLVYEGSLDAARLNKALGLAQRLKEEPNDYQTTADRCLCPDSAWRTAHICKHRLSAILRTNGLDS
jgi:hypothetical protein